MEPAELLGPGLAGAAGRALGRVEPGREGGEERREPRDGLVLAADHQAEAALEAEDAAARPHVDVVDPALGELARAADVVVVARVAAVDHRVARLEQRPELGDGPRR